MPVIYLTNNLHFRHKVIYANTVKQSKLSTEGKTGIHKHYRLSFTSKLILYFIISLCISTIAVGLTGYLIARNELNKKGEQILKNSVIQALYLIKSKYSQAEAGLLSAASAQENVKQILSGPLDSTNGTRSLHHNIDLGENGYFIIYDSAGNEVMHPTIEGQNVWTVTDLKDKSYLLVQDQIEQAKNGGGFQYYYWTLPYSRAIEPKIAYSSYFAPWDWIVVASAYEVDFSQGADSIFLILISLILLLVFTVSSIIAGYIKRASQPIIDVSKGMTDVIRKIYNPVEKTFTNDDVDKLIDGYNHMIDSLVTAEEDIKRKSEYITFLAYHDDLTELPNRHGLESHITRRIENGCTTGYMIQADILGLKIINSTLGFEQGDNLLRIIGAYLLKLNNPDIYAARTSSNEFTLWAENRSFTDMQQHIYELREAVKQHVNENGYGQIVDMYLSMSIYPSDGTSFRELYEKTTMAMKLSKDNNDLSITRYQEEIRLSLENELSMRRYLTKALETREITAYYQKQVDYVSSKVVGVEALARWNSEELGFVSPAVFIPAINQLNLVSSFSNYMIDHVLGDYTRLIHKYNSEITVSINISPSFFMDKNFYANLQTALKKNPVPPGKLTLEITEDIFITDFDLITEKINDLHKLGVRISIDDFGTGYSSLNYLTRMNFDEMKIDKSFINKIIEEPKSFQLFEILCNIAEIYGYDIVAEGVETELQLEKIKSTSLRIIQGYLFSKPEPLD